MAAGSIPRHPDRRPRPLRSLRFAALLLAAHPVIALGLGTALVLSLGAVCCGLGLISAPWFACELSALVLGTALGRRVPRHTGWIGAGLVQALAVVVVSAAAGAAVSWWGSRVAMSPEPPAPLPTNDPAVAGLALGGSAVALLYMAPYLYAPVLLIDRGGSLGGALVESARLVMRGGLIAHFAFSFVSHLLQVAPPLIAGTVAYVTGDPGSVPLAVAAALPAMVLTVPLGQGMIVVSYAVRRPEASGRPLHAPVGRSLAAGLASVGLAPAVALILVTLAVAVRPSDPRSGRAPLGELVAGGAVAERPRTFPIPHRGLEVRVGPRTLDVVAGDGGGVGRIPRPDGATFDRVRVVRVRSAFAIEVGDGDRSWVTWVDGSGVRLDDDLPARLSDHLPPWGLAVLGVAMAATAVLLAPTLRRLGRDPRRHRRRAWLVLAGLAPLVLAALALGVRALVA